MAAGRVSSVFRPGLFVGKSAIVTGGATGIGCAIAQELLHLGEKFTINQRRGHNHYAWDLIMLHLKFKCRNNKGP